MPYDGSDRHFLAWIHARLEHVYGENNLYDYMHRLRAIVMNTDPQQVSQPNPKDSEAFYKEFSGA